MPVGKEILPRSLQKTISIRSLIVSHQQNDVTTAAEYICLHLHPKELRSNYVHDIRVEYSADPIVYVLQELSTGMTALFIGLITNYLFEKTKKPDPTIINIQALLKKQNTKLNKLEKYIVREKDDELKKIANKHLKLHNETLRRIENFDPNLYELVDEVLCQMQQRGHQSLVDEIDSHLDE